MKRVGSKSEVYFGYAKKTKNGETQEHFVLSPKGNVVLKTSIKHTKGGSFFVSSLMSAPKKHVSSTIIQRPTPSWLHN